jgi:hypothetical protein
LTVENFRSNVVRSSNSGIGHGTAGLSPGVDLTTVGYGKIDGIVEITRVAVPIFGSRVLEEVLIISVIVCFLASGRKTEVSKFDVTTPVKQDVVRLDITARKHDCQLKFGKRPAIVGAYDQTLLTGIEGTYR